MQDKMFDMIDITSEIERAKSMLDGANEAFQKHAIRFDNSDVVEPEAVTLARKTERNRNLQAATAYFDAPRETPRPKKPLFKWTKMLEVEKDPPGLVQGIYNRRARINSLVGDDALADAPEEAIREERPAPKAPKERSKKKRSLIKRKKSVSF